MSEHYENCHTFVGDLSDASSLGGELLVKVKEVEGGGRRLMEGRREEGWLQRRERCLKCRLDERQRLMFQSQVCVGPEGETESDGELTKQNVTTMQ